MNILGKIKVTTELPPELARLKDIAYNLWWSWNNEAIDLYRAIDLPLWEKLNKNPVRFLQEVNNMKLRKYCLIKPLWRNTGMLLNGLINI